MPNNDYILRADALKAVCENCSMHGDEGEPCSSRCEDYALVLKIPAADVEGKRMTGVWLEQDETPNVSSNKIYRCSVCGYVDEQSPSAEVPYCWHCGSKMKKMFRGGGE